MSRGKTENLFFTSEYALLKDRWKHTGDRQTLAQIVESSPPFGDVEIGKAIADALRDKYPDEKAKNYIMWREIDRLFGWLTNDEGKSDVAAYNSIIDIYFSDAENRTVADVRKQHMRWVKKAGQSF